MNITIKDKEFKDKEEIINFCLQIIEQDKTSSVQRMIDFQNAGLDFYDPYKKYEVIEEIYSCIPAFTGKKLIFEKTDVEGIVTVIAFTPTANKEPGILRPTQHKTYLSIVRHIVEIYLGERDFED